ncbi:MAG TPA: Uma2 family endonuclease [Phycisphaerae bacterium]
MTTTATLLTAEELLNLPPDNMRHELVKGELTTTPPTSGEHGVRSFNIAALLSTYLRGKDVGVGVGAETGFVIARNPDTVRAPDCAFIQKARIPATGIPQKYWPGAPDLAVEILSPSDSASEVLEKIDEWLDAGTRLVWVVDPEKQNVRVYAPGRKPLILRMPDTLDGEDVLPGLRLKVADIFA